MDHDAGASCSSPAALPGLFLRSDTASSASTLSASTLSTAPPGCPVAGAPLVLLRDWSWGCRVWLVCLLIWFTAQWTHRLVLPARVGWPRLAASLPALAALAVAALVFDPYSEPLSTMTTAFMTLRMPATKLLAACYGRGPLAELPAEGGSAPHGQQGRRKGGRGGSVGPAAARGRGVLGWVGGAWRRMTSRHGCRGAGAEPAGGWSGGKGSGGNGSTCGSRGSKSDSGGALDVCVPAEPLVTFFLFAPVAPAPPPCQSRRRQQQAEHSAGPSPSTSSPGGLEAASTSSSISLSSSSSSGSSISRSGSSISSSGAGIAILGRRLLQPLHSSAATKWLELAAAAAALAAVSTLDSWIGSISGNGSSSRSYTDFVRTAHTAGPSPFAHQRQPPLLLHLLLPPTVLPHYLSLLPSRAATAGPAAVLLLRLLRRLTRGGAALCLHAVLATAMAAGVGGMMDCMAAYCYCRGWSGDGGGGCSGGKCCGSNRQEHGQQKRGEELRGETEEEEKEQCTRGDEGVALVRPFDSPLAATSLADFWGRRWNVTQSRVLKGLLYDPILEGSWQPTHHSLLQPPSAPPRQPLQPACPGGGSSNSSSSTGSRAPSVGEDAGAGAGVGADGVADRSSSAGSARSGSSCAIDGGNSNGTTSCSRSSSSSSEGGGRGSSNAAGASSRSNSSGCDMAAAGSCWTGGATAVLTAQNGTSITGSGNGNGSGGSSGSGSSTSPEPPTMPRHQQHDALSGGLHRRRVAFRQDAAAADATTAAPALAAAAVATAAGIGASTRSMEHAPATAGTAAVSTMGLQSVRYGSSGGNGRGDGSPCCPVSSATGHSSSSGATTTCSLEAHDRTPQDLRALPQQHQHQQQHQQQQQQRQQQHQHPEHGRHPQQHPADPYHQARKAAALLAVFVWSGLEHELFHWLCTRRLSPGGGWFLFFAAHGGLLVAESAATRAARHCARSLGLPYDTTTALSSGALPHSRIICSARGGAVGRAAAAAAAALLPPPMWLRRLLTLAVLDVTAAVWFFPVLTERCVVRRVAAAVADVCPPALGQRLLHAAAELGRQ